MKLFGIFMVIASTSFAVPTYVCTARSLLGKAYRATGPNEELTMLQALQSCEADNARCVRGSCREAGTIPGPVNLTYNPGDTVGDLCWTNEQGTETCLDAYSGVRVLLFNAGWCGPCNDEFDEISTSIGAYQGKATFIGVSGAGFSRNQKPDQNFLQQWRQRHNLPQEMVLVGKFGEYGQQFNQSAIPNVAVIDAKNKLTFSDTAPGVDEILRQVDAAQGK